ncbi:hypothetical protein BST97_06650 [Nonlabens spongiae]|uniref:Secretion system C-terminal sorting domain-containing protein n=1 Tax=Nonlabens spongiae TaxID=331648 RepID=A0A1W6MJB2_9FLAO|nr:T9SS type A sorting domain-containing protein [Nonlabens spongiae]ARN77701.1 hypothetical protein BST97_06650 [Nonlabens spongiae]
MSFITKTFFFISFLLTAQSAMAQAPSMDWQNTLGGSGRDNLATMIANDDGTFLLVSISNSGISGDKTVSNKGGYDTWLMKIDALGNSLWQESIGGSGDDFPRAAVKSNDGGYVIFMSSDSGISGDKTEDSNGLNDLWVVKVDASGSIVWQNTIGGDGEDFARTAFDNTSDGGYILAGITRSTISGDQTNASKGLVDIWLIKLDANGVIDWQNRIGGNDDDFPNVVRQTTDGGYIIGTFSYSDASGDKSEDASNWNDYWVIKTDATGNVVWENTIGGDGTEVLTDLLITDTGNYLLTGYSNSNSSRDKTENAIGNYDYWIMELDQTGAIVWQKTIGGTRRDDAWGIIKDGADYLISGQSESRISGNKTEGNRGWYDYWLVKIDASGTVLWDKTLGGNLGDHLFKTYPTSDGYMLAGHTESSASGDRTENARDWDLWIVKLNPDQTASSNDLNRAQISIAPNPASDVIYIEAEVPTTAKLYDLQGRLMRATQSNEVQVHNLTTGTYILQVFDTENHLLQTFKFLRE